MIQGWGVAVLVGVPHKEAEFKTHPMNFLNERTLKGTFFGNYKPRTDLPKVVEMYMNKVIVITKLKVPGLYILSIYHCCNTDGFFATNFFCDVCD
jgi:Zn-dependent alcohol dehydrogenase